jgi:putative flippase GtrA
MLEVWRMRAFQHRHGFGQGALAVSMTLTMAVLFVLFERTFVWPAAIVAIGALVIVFVTNRDMPHRLFWAIVAVVCVITVAVLLWLA